MRKQFSWFQRCSDSSINRPKGKGRRWDFVRLTMPMNSRINRQFVSYEYFNVISFININQRAGLLAIDKIDLATDTVWSTSIRFHKTISEGTGCSTCLEH